MKGRIGITAAGIVDPQGVRGTSGIRETWQALAQDPVRGIIRFKPVFGTPFRDFRRLDTLSRMFITAVEACGLIDRLGDETRTETALVLASATGCLAADLRFERSLHTEAGIEPAVFPYTLPSTCLGEVAIRHHLRGPTLCLSVEPGEEGVGLAVARRLLEGREADAALVLAGDWVAREEIASPTGAGASEESKTHAAALLLSPIDPDTPHLIELDRILIGPGGYPVGVDLASIVSSLSPWLPPFS